jgi:putative Holliday junction resolvase
MKESKPSGEREGRLIGLDVGERRVGVAVSDQMNIMAIPECVIERTSLEEDLRTICDLAREKQAERVIVGLPLRLDGSHGQEAQRVTAFARKLAERAGIPVEMADERLSTKEAERGLISRDVKRRRRRKIIDKVAAQIILQTYMDARNARDEQVPQ